MDLTTQTVPQLKALAYDHLAEINRLQQGLSLVQQELARQMEMAGVRTAPEQPIAEPK